jgi:hypothetical protein
MPRKKFQNEVSQDIIDRIWGRGYLTGFELCRIGAWKSAQSVALLTVNDESQIEFVTRRSLTAIGEFRDVNVVSDSFNWGNWYVAASTAIGQSRKKPATGLLSLHGVGYPLATALLAVLAPRAFPVLDRWAVSEVFGVTPDEGRESRWHSADHYMEYCRRLATDDRAEFKNLSIHHRDQWMMNRGIQTSKL